MLYYLTFDGSLGEDVASLLLCFFTFLFSRGSRIGLWGVKPQEI